MLQSKSDTKDALCKPEFAQDIDLAVDESLAKILGWREVYSGADGEPYKVVGLVKGQLNLHLIFERKIKDGNRFLRSQKTQVLNREQMKGFGKWFFEKRTGLLEMIIRNLLIVDTILIHYNHYEDNKVIDEVKFLLSCFR